MFILLHGRSNKTLYGDVSLIPLPADYQPSVQQLPGTGTGLDKGKTRGSIMPRVLPYEKVGNKEKKGNRQIYYHHRFSAEMSKIIQEIRVIG